MQQYNTSLVRIPTSSWARIILILFGLGLLWQFFAGHQVELFWFCAGVIATVAIANRFENQQQQLYLLQQYIFDLEKQMQTMNLSAAESQKPPVTSHDDENADLQQITPEIIQNDTIQDNKTQTVQPVIVGNAQLESISRDIATPVQQSYPTENQSIVNQNQDATLKELKVMTSLWDAAINWFKGGNSIVRIAVVILLIGVILLLRFASEYWSLTLSAKMAGIAISGFVLTGLGYALRQKRFEYAISLQGAGLGIVFLVLFSSYRLGVVQSVGMSYAALILLLAGTLLLALRQNALILAFIALGSGFIAPFILNTGTNNIAALMAYYFALNSALAVIAWFKPWRILNTVALLMTFGIGGFAIWFNVQAEQKFQISCWVWAIFILYLFISIRYSQLIVNLKTQFQDIPYIDTTLIFATPFMAFSLYAGLVDSDGYALSIASTILALVYVSMGYILHKKSQQLSILAQCFYGLGLVFLALILPFACDAYWTSVGWAIHGVVMILLGWRYGLRNARYFGVVLLLASGIATLMSAIFDHQLVLFANTILMITYVVAAYCLHYPYREKSQTLIVSDAGERVVAYGLIVLTFAALAPYEYRQIIQSLFDRLQYNLGLAFLLCYLILSFVFWLKEKNFYKEWQFIGAIILFWSAIGIGGILLTQDLFDFYFNAIDLDPAKKSALVADSALWCATFWIYLRYIQPPSAVSYPFVRQALIVFAIMMLAMLGSIWSAVPVMSVLWVVLPLLVLIASLKIKPLQFLQKLWQGNIGVIALGLIWLWMVSITDAGYGKIGYVMLINPIDLGSMVVFIVLLLAIKPYLLNPQREVQLMSATVVLLSGLLLVSSIMLRILHHYADLPYWSAQAWENSIVQMSLTILWASVALVLTTLASRKAWRYIWMLGIAVLAIVIAKLIFLDLSHSHTLMRIVSFIGSGLIMLVIGYFSPLPPAQQAIDASKNPS